ncbi:MAG: hypothetical protein GY801_49015 [bacterium]|nr:hypothetical protein [bacterium]
MGYIDGKPVIEKQMVKDPVPSRLLTTVDDASLQADGIDVTRVVFRMEDQAGNLLPFAHDFLKLSIKGRERSSGRMKCR